MRAELGHRTESKAPVGLTADPTSAGAVLAEAVRQVVLQYQQADPRARRGTTLARLEPLHAAALRAHSAVCRAEGQLYCELNTFQKWSTWHSQEV